MRVTLKKNEILKSQLEIEQIFEHKNSIKQYPFIIHFKNYSDNSKTKVAFSVPKKRVKLATDRNRVKRLIREAYRLNKENFLIELNTNDHQLSMFIIYIGSSNPDFEEIENKLILSLDKILLKVNTKQE